MPAYTNLLNCLEKRANCSLIVHKKPTQTVGQYNRSPSGKFGGNKPPSRSHAFVTASHTNEIRYPREQETSERATANLPRCPICNGEHGIWCCEKFHALSISSRLTAVKKASLCSNCLRAKHNLDICKKGSCRICQRHHHTLLHQPRQPLDGATSSPPTSPGAAADPQVDTTD
ncbi:hypothetical protein ANTQUA_LOCUS6007 [Anthophora quadrimaculata]